jgi:hypothetical protein
MRRALATAALVGGLVGLTTFPSAAQRVDAFGAGPGFGPSSHFANQPGAAYGAFAMAGDESRQGVRTRSAIRSSRAGVRGRSRVGSTAGMRNTQGNPEMPAADTSAANTGTTGVGGPRTMTPGGGRGYIGR